MYRGVKSRTVLCLAAMLSCVSLARADYEAGQVAWKAGRHAEALAQWRAAARTGDGEAMLAIGRAYLHGLGVPQDYILAHMWLDLAVGRGSAKAVPERDALAVNMHPQHIAEAQGRAREWLSGRGTVAPKAAAVPSVASPSTPAGPPPPRAIREAQALMMALGYEPGLADGRWGPRTGRAYRAFLRDAGLPPGNVLTPPALRAMRAAAEGRNVAAAVSSPRLAPATQRKRTRPAANLHRQRAGQTAWQAGRYAEALAQWRDAARTGDGRAMLALGRAYLKGLGVPQDFVLAHMWFNLSASRGEAQAPKERDVLSSRMTPGQIASAQDRARAWRPGAPAAVPRATPAPTTSAGPPPKRALAEAQRLLNALGYEAGAPDGVWGPNSIRAYGAFLRESGLPPAESLTPDTLRAMRKAAGDKPAAKPVRRTPKPVADLHRIVEAGDIDGLKKALAGKNARVNARDAHGWTPLMHAVNKGYTLLVPPLLKAGADPNIRLADGATALFMAAVHGQAKVVAALVKVGGDPTVRGPRGKTTEDLVRNSNNMDLIKAVGLIETIPYKQTGGQIVSHCIKVRKESLSNTWPNGEVYWRYRWNLKNVCDKPVHVNYCLSYLSPSDARADNSTYYPNCKTGRPTNRWTTHRNMFLDPHEERVARGPGSSGEKLGRRRTLLFGACEKGYRAKRIIGTRNYNCYCDIKDGCPSIRGK